ncbi:MAG: hypothetical protein GY767_08055 [Shimia sp.]|nr:hypothetical protein [Shimia sp.]
MNTERDVHEMCRTLADQMFAFILGAIVEDAEFRCETSQAVRSQGKKYINGGYRQVKVTLSGGTTTTVKVPYLRPDLSMRPGPKRGHGRRGKGGVGVYPVLAALGIWFGVTPALLHDVCKQVTASESLRAGRAALEDLHFDPGHKQAQRLLERAGYRMLEQRGDWLARTRAEPPATGPLAGKRIVVALDGGRLRERKSSGRGRRRAKTGHRGFDTPWREPKMFVIYAIDDEGEIDEDFRFVDDGTLEDCDAVFDMLEGYLKALGAADCKDFIVAGDGARWIWDRIDDLVDKVGIDKHKVSQVIDWCHAVSTLHTIVDYAKSLTTAERDSWLHAAKDLLFAGKTGELIEHIDTLAVGRRAKKIRKHRPYFENNVIRMQYATFRAANIPRGSGAVESAIRCIINQRLKGCGKFWKERNAEAMILMRSYLKAGRFDDLFAWSLAEATPWWHHDTPYARSPGVWILWNNRNTSDCGWLVHR